MRERTVGVPFFGDWLHGVLQNAVNAVFDRDFRIACFDVNVAGATLKCRENYRFDQSYDRASRRVSSQSVA